MMKGGKVKSLTVTSFYGKGHIRRKQKKIETALNKRVQKYQDCRIPLEFPQSLSGPTDFWRTFFRQADAFDCAKQVADGVHVFAYESTSKDPILQKGHRQYLVTSIPVFFHYYSQLDQSRKQHYEIIPEGSPCKLYFDLEYDKEANVSSNGNAMVDILTKYVLDWLKVCFNIDCGTSAVLRLDASTEKKFSQHLIFQLSRTVFESNVAAGRFVHFIFGALKEHLELTDSSHQNTSEPARETLDSEGTKSSISVEHQRPWLSEGISEVQSESCDTNTCQDVENFQMLIQSESVMPILHGFQNASTSFQNSSPAKAIGSSTKNAHGKNKPVEALDCDNDDHNEDFLGDEICLLGESVAKKGEGEVNVFDENKVVKLSDQENISSTGKEVNQGGSDTTFQPSDGEEVQEWLLAMKREFFSKLSHRELELLSTLIVKTKKGASTWFCDLGVYTRNRNFRLYESSKLNQNNPLLEAKENQFKPADSSNENREFFYASLVTNVCLDPSVQVLRFSSSYDHRCSSFANNKRKNPRHPLTAESDLNEGVMDGYSCSSPFPEIDNFVMNLVQKNGCQGYVRRWTYFKATQSLIYDMCGYRWCGNIQRQHCSNNIMFVIDLTKGTYVQKCHDPECQAVNYRSEEKALPKEVLLDHFFETDEFEGSQAVEEAASADDGFGEDHNDQDLLTAVAEYDKWTVD